MLCFIRTLVEVSIVHFPSFEILCIIEVAQVFFVKRKKPALQIKTNVNIVQTLFHTQKSFWSIWFLSSFPHMLGGFHGPEATFLHALGRNYIPRIRNKLFTDVLIAVVSLF